MEQRSKDICRNVAKGNSFIILEPGCYACAYRLVRIF